MTLVQDTASCGTGEPNSAIPHDLTPRDHRYLDEAGSPQAHGRL